MKCPILSIGKDQPADCLKKQCQFWTGIYAETDRNKKEPFNNCAIVIGAVKGENGIARTLPDAVRTAGIPPGGIS